MHFIMKVRFEIDDLGRIKRNGLILRSLGNQLEERYPIFVD